MALTDLILNISVEEILNMLLLTLISAAFIKKHFESKWLQTHYFCTLSISERFAIQEGCMLANSLQLKLIIGVFFSSCFTFFLSFQTITFNWGDGDYYTGIYFPDSVIHKIPLCLWLSGDLHFTCTVLLVDRAAFHDFIQKDWPNLLKFYSWLP